MPGMERDIVKLINTFVVKQAGQTNYLAPQKVQRRGRNPTFAYFLLAPQRV
jgi:hypothetical protein